MHLEAQQTKPYDLQSFFFFACTEMQRDALHCVSILKTSPRRKDRNGQRGMQPTRTCIGRACGQLTRGWLLACGLAPDFCRRPFSLSSFIVLLLVLARLPFSLSGRISVWDEKGQTPKKCRCACAFLRRITVNSAPSEFASAK